MVNQDEILAWYEMSDCWEECGWNYHGSQPWSEPETRAVRDVVLNNNVTAAISFHSRHRQDQIPLLIHPYTSARNFERNMPYRDRRRFRSWSNVLNKDQFYVTGTAEEAIEYTAGGSTIDWMYSVGAIPFVVETVPPCDDRWCSYLPDDEVWEAIERYGSTGHQLIQLVIDEYSLRSRRWSSDSSVLAIIALFAFISLLGLLSHIKRRWRNKYTEMRQSDDIEDQVEMGDLT